MIKVDENYYINSDKYCYQVMMKYDNKEEATYKTISFHNTFHECIEKILTLKQREVVKNSDSLENVLFKFQELNNEMQSILDRFKNIENGGIKND